MSAYMQHTKCTPPSDATKPSNLNCVYVCVPVPGQTCHLKLEDPLLDAASNDKTCHMDGLVLPQPVNPVLCLLFHCRVPPTIHHNHEKPDLVVMTTVTDVDGNHCAFD